ncbi:ATP-binding protein [Streptomyces capparidis]
MSETSSAGPGRPVRPAVTELRLAAFKSHRGVRLRLGPLTVLVGGSGVGKTNALEGLALLGALAGGAPLAEAFGAVRGGAAGCVPLGPGHGRAAGLLRLGCTVDGPVGPVSLDVAVRAGPQGPRVAGERLTRAGVTLLETALRDPARRRVQAAWHTGGRCGVTRAALPDDRLGSALLPLRVAGRTEGQRLVLAAAEQLLVGLRAVFPVDPDPGSMRGWVDAGEGRLHASARNLSAVVRRTEAECRVRHRLLGEALRAVCPYEVAGVRAVPGPAGTVMAAVDRAGLGPVPAALLGGGELRALALALVLLTGPGVLAVDAAEVPDALQLLTVAADDLDRGLDRPQLRELLALAARMCERGHVRLLATAHTREWVADVAGVSAVPLGRAPLAG